MKILSESVSANDIAFNDYSIILEQKNANSPSKIKIRGPYIACDVKNVNRSYI